MLRVESSLYLDLHSTAITNQKTNAHRPIAVLLASILTFSALIPPLADYLIEYFARDPLETAFKYPGSSRPSLDIVTYLSLISFILLSQFLVLIFCVTSGIGILNKHRWAWFLGIGTHLLILLINILTIMFVSNPSIAQYASIMISLTSLYMLTRIDVREYLKAVTNT